MRKQVRGTPRWPAAPSSARLAGINERVVSGVVTPLMTRSMETGVQGEGHLDQRHVRLGVNTPC